MVKEGAEHHPVVLLKKDNMDADKTFPVVNLAPLRFIDGPSKQVITGNIQGAWDPDRSVAVVKDVIIPMEESFSDIGMNSKRTVIRL